ncbi:MAG TPA: lyase family protein, partial [Candidatus Thermoplasmatota archaeon]|nr:lyase family protein [Candidatus Thermoplasmatota archaeon]
MDLVCPLDFRYGRKEMKALWTEEARLRYLLQVEAALAHAHAATGTIPKEAARRLQKVADSGRVTPERVKEIEAEIKHDLMAVVKAMTEAAGPEDGKFIHLGATSYDIIDTANSLQFRDAMALLRGGLRRVRDALLHQADAHRHTTMLGRTHGQAAVPITFGLKMAVYASEVGRHLERLAEVEKRIAVGMMSGATGSMAAFRGKGIGPGRRLQAPRAAPRHRQHPDHPARPLHRAVQPPGQRGHQPGEVQHRGAHPAAHRDRGGGGGLRRQAAGGQQH